MPCFNNDISLSEVRNWLQNIQRVEHIHDLHIWPLSTTENSLTVHLVVSDDTLDNRFLSDLQRELHDRFGIAHATLQVEHADGENGCRLNRRNCTE
jgi:cobalt-zinc-cadmium efflux system protein